MAVRRPPLDGAAGAAALSWPRSRCTDTLPQPPYGDDGDDKTTGDGDGGDPLSATMTDNSHRCPSPGARVSTFLGDGGVAAVALVVAVGDVGVVHRIRSYDFAELLGDQCRTLYGNEQQKKALSQ